MEQFTLVNSLFQPVNLSTRIADRSGDCFQTRDHIYTLVPSLCPTTSIVLRVTQRTVVLLGLSINSPTIALYLIHNTNCTLAIYALPVPLRCAIVPMIFSANHTRKPRLLFPICNQFPFSKSSYSFANLLPLFLIFHVVLALGG